MGRLRSFYDADRENKFAVPTIYQTEQNQNELFCGMCGETFFVSDSIFDKANKTLEKKLENPFLCEDCLEEYEE